MSFKAPEGSNVGNTGLGLDVLCLVCKYRYGQHYYGPKDKAFATTCPPDYNRKEYPLLYKKSMILFNMSLIDEDRGENNNG